MRLEAAQHWLNVGRRANEIVPHPAQGLQSPSEFGLQGVEACSAVKAKRDTPQYQRVPQFDEVHYRLTTLIVAALRKM